MNKKVITALSGAVVGLILGVVLARHMLVLFVDVIIIAAVAGGCYWLFNKVRK